MALVHYLHFDRSLRKVSSVYGCSPSTLCRWVKKHHSGTSHPKKMSRKSIISQIENVVDDYITQKPFNRLIDIVHHLRERGICISKSTAYRILRKAKFTRKRASAKYCPKLPTREEATAYLSNFRSEKEVISIDESSIYLESRPLYGYSKKGTRLSKTMNKPLRGNRITLILAISNKRGVVHHEVVKGSANAKIFSNFIASVKVPEDASVLLDNVRFHHSKCVKDAAATKKMTLVYTPPYQPDFNPVENAFSVIKSHTRRFDDSLEGGLSLVALTKIQAFFRHAESYVQQYVCALLFAT